MLSGALVAKVTSPQVADEADSLHKGGETAAIHRTQSRDSWKGVQLQFVGGLIIWFFVGRITNSNRKKLVTTKCNKGST
jgi:hypothetical protein